MCYSQYFHAKDRTIMQLSHTIEPVGQLSPHGTSVSMAQESHSSEENLSQEMAQTLVSLWKPIVFVLTDTKL